MKGILNVSNFYKSIKFINDCINSHLSLKSQSEIQIFFATFYLISHFKKNFIYFIFGMFLSEYMNKKYSKLFVHCYIVYTFSGGSDSEESACNAGDLSSIPGSGRSSGEGNGNPLQGIFLTRELNEGLLPCRWILYQLSFLKSKMALGKWALAAARHLNTLRLTSKTLT